MDMLPGVITPGTQALSLQPAPHGTGRDTRKSRVLGHASSQFSPAPSREWDVFLLGQATGNCGDLRANLRGKTSRRATAGRISKLMGFDPPPTPFANGAIGCAQGQGQLLIALLGMGMCLENDPSTQSHCLRCGMRSYQVFEISDFCIGQGYWIAGLGTMHGVYLLLPAYLFPLALSNSEGTCDRLY